MNECEKAKMLQFASIDLIKDIALLKMTTVVSSWLYSPFQLSDAD